MGGRVGGAAGVGDDDGAVAEVGGRRAVPSTEKLVATPNRTVSTPRLRSRWSSWLAENPPTRVGDDQSSACGVSSSRICAVAALHQAPLLARRRRGS